LDDTRYCLPRELRRCIVLERYFSDGVGVIANYDLFGRHCRASYPTPFLDENLLVDRYFCFGRVKRYWYTQDGLGSVRQLVVGDTVQNGYAYTAWGVPLSWHEKVSNRYTYTAREYNHETDLYHYRQREYYVEAVRFMSRENLVLRKSTNGYTYVLNNSVTYRDPFGMQRREIEWEWKLHQKILRERKLRALKKQYLKKVKDFITLKHYAGTCFSRVVSLGDPQKAERAMEHVEGIEVSLRPELKEAGTYDGWSNTIWLNARVLGEVDAKTLWHELMHALFDAKSWWGSISDIDEERYTMFMEGASSALEALKCLEDRAFSADKGVQPDKPCPQRNVEAIRRFWERFIELMKEARRGWVGVGVCWEKQPPPLTEVNLRNLKRWTGIDVDPNKVLRLYRGEIEVKDKCCHCCGTTPLKEIIRDRPPIQW